MPLHPLRQHHHLVNSAMQSQWLVVQRDTVGTALALSACTHSIPLSCAVTAAALAAVTGEVWNTVVMSRAVQNLCCSATAGVIGLCRAERQGRHIAWLP